MKYLTIILLLASCASQPQKPVQKAMMNCKPTKDNYSICEEIPEHVVKSPPLDREYPHSTAFRY
jgi:hypothetical protein